MATRADTSQARRIELILREIDSLPTLPAIATRLLTLTSDDESDAQEVIELISTDPALTAKILSMCRKAALGVRNEALSVERAVVLLGFDAIRTAVLSIKVFEIFDTPRHGAPKPTPSQAQPRAVAAVGAPANDRMGTAAAHPNGSGNGNGNGHHNGNGSAGSPNGNGSRNGNGQTNTADDPSSKPHFDRLNFWRHSLAVGITAELIAATDRQSHISKGDAFVCGLMHDLGKLALDYVLPKSYARVIELTDLNHGNISELERRVIGLDHHTAGKRLAEQWQLPHIIMDCLWLHGSEFESLPPLDHRRLIGLIHLADLIVRRLHVGYSGNNNFDRDPADVAEAIGFDRDVAEKITPRMFEELNRREKLLDLEQIPSNELVLESVQRANNALGRLNNKLVRNTSVVAKQAEVLGAITEFNHDAWPGQTTQDVLDSVVANAINVLGEGHYAALYQPGTDNATGGDRQWLVCQYSKQGRSLRSELVDPPPNSPSLSILNASQPTSMSATGVLPWISDYSLDDLKAHQVQLIPLVCGWGTVAVLLHDQPKLPQQDQLAALAVSWGTRVAAAIQHEGARRLGEDLAEANRALAEAQEQLLRSESMARLGEMAAGAAHEMNNPLAVISGNCQVLSVSLDPNTKQHKAAKVITDQCQRLSDLITSLRMFADPPKPKMKPTDIGSVLDGAVRKAKSELLKPSSMPTNVSLKVGREIPALMVDPDQIALAIRELIRNALQATPKTSVYVTARYDRSQNAVVVEVTDDGQGMEAHTLAHAFDPFFSAKPAGRQIGMGLARAKQLIDTHDGTLDLRSTPESGTVATLILPLDSPS